MSTTPQTHMAAPNPMRIKTGLRAFNVAHLLWVVLPLSVVSKAPVLTEPAPGTLNPPPHPPSSVHPNHCRHNGCLTPIPGLATTLKAANPALTSHFATLLAVSQKQVGVMRPLTRLITPPIRASCYRFPALISSSKS